MNKGSKVLISFIIRILVIIILGFVDVYCISNFFGTMSLSFLSLGLLKASIPPFVWLIIALISFIIQIVILFSLGRLLKKDKEDDKGTNEIKGMIRILTTSILIIFIIVLFIIILIELGIIHP